MRKRRRAPRQRTGQEEMWFTVPSHEPAAQEGDLGPARPEEPTYEDPWYQVLRRRITERASSD